MILPKETPMIERLALAILNSDREAAGLPSFASRDTVPDSDGYVRNAHAVLTALREPTPRMRKAGEIEMKARHPNLDCFNDPFVDSTWQAMINAALNEGEG